MGRDSITFHPVFPGAKLGLMKCMVEGCPWEYVGPRGTFSPAWQQHRRLEHMDDVAVVITHHGNSRLDDLLTMQKQAQAQKPREQIILAR